MYETDHSESKYELLIQQSQARLRHYIFAIFPNHSASDDILQETNRILWEKRDEFDIGTNFLAWSRTIARFQTLSYLKSAKRKSWLSFDSELVVTLASVVESRDEIRESKSFALQGCLKKISSSDQELVTLRYTSKFSLKQIGDSVSRSEGALKQAFRRIRSQLKVCIERTLLGSLEQSSEDVEASNSVDRKASP